MISAITPAEFPWFRYDGYTFSLGLTDGERAWLSGHSASRYDPNEKRIVVTGEMSDQAELAYAKVRTILTAGGFDGSDVSHLVENVTVDGLDARTAAGPARAGLLGDHAPPLTTVVVERLLRSRALIEVEGNARRGGTDDDEIVLETILPVDDTGHLVAAGDLTKQYETCRRRAAGRLAERGLDLSHVVAVTECLASSGASDHPRLGEMRRYGPVSPAIIPVVASRSQLAGALVALNVTAARDAPSPVTAPTGITAVRAGSVVRIAGIGAAGPDAAPDDVVAQAERVYDGILAALRELGHEPKRLVRTIEYVHRDALRGYREVAGVRAERLQRPWPASTGAVCAQLPVAGALIAVDAMARVPA